MDGDIVVLPEPEAPRPPEDQVVRKESGCLGVGCFVVIVILMILVAVAYLALAAVGEALDSFFGGVEDFFNVFENLFKGG
jgi:hypothetical protein